MDMQANPFAPEFKDLPESLPVFPLPGVLLLPNGRLPLNVFEPRYKKMVESALVGNRLIGMIQSRGGGEKPDLFETGCAGKITNFEETNDGRYLITLTGICRFKIAWELDVITLYRQVRPDWSAYEKDLEAHPCLKIDREKLLKLLKTYFISNEMTCDWQAVDGAPDARLITCLAMICPFDAQEKQALLEAPCCQTRAEAFMAMLEMETRGKCAGPCH
ncbi:MAG: LON peptidase substrate-binding domain-containing protein [Alphaproteobacteria bacterium]